MPTTKPGRHLLLALLILSPLRLTLAGEFDVVTLRNGNILNGTVAQRHFTLVTSLGTLSIPYARMESLVRTSSGFVVRTTRGEQLSGHLQESELTMLRVLDPTIPVARGDIREIAFHHDPLRRKQPLQPDVLETADGSRLYGKVLSRELMVQLPQGLKLISTGDLFLIDLYRRQDEDRLHIRVIDTSGKHTIATLLSSFVDFTSQYISDSRIDAKAVRRIGLGVHHNETDRSFDFQRRLQLWARVQDRLRNGEMAPELAALRGGHFLRGSDAEDADADEKPPVEVNLKPFAIGVTEVTYSQYEQYCRSQRATCPQHDEPGDHPVVNVSWNEAVEYTRWLSRQTGKRYRLPSDAEWEYAARAGSRTRFWWGDDPGRDRANCQGCATLWDGDSSAPVGRFDSNPFGLQDTAGNVFEWVADCWHDRFSEAPRDGSPLQKRDCGKRVIRGGAWSFPPHEIRSANRWRDFPSRRSDDTGFRITRDL